MKGQTLQEWAGSSRIFALVFTDIVDSTALANELGDERWIELLLKHFAQARLLMAQHDHHEIKIIGDSFMVVFRSVVDALDFILAFHSQTGNARIKIRAGIHVGPARIIEDDIYGMMVNYTKRVESQAGGLGIAISEEAKRHIDYEKAARHSQLRFSRPFSVPFKGFAQPQIIFRVIYPIAPLTRVRRSASETNERPRLLLRPSESTPDPPPYSLRRPLKRTSKLLV